MEVSLLIFNAVILFTTISNPKGEILLGEAGIYALKNLC